MSRSRAAIRSNAREAGLAPAFSGRASAWEWTQAGLLSVNLVWTTLCLGGYRPETLVVTSGLTGLLLAIHFGGCAMGWGAPAALRSNIPAVAGRDEQEVRLRLFHPAGWLFLPFLVYAAGNVLWVSPVRWLGWLDWFGFAQIIAVFWVVLNGVRSPAPRHLLFGVLVALGVVAVVLGCYQRFIDPDWMMLGRTQVIYFIGRASGPFGIPNSLAAFLLLLIPALGALTFRRHATETARILCGWLLLVLGFGLMLTLSRGAWIGLAVALVVWPMAVTRWKWRRRIVIAGAVLAAVVLAAGSLYQASPKARERLEILVQDMGERSRPILWRASWELFREFPVLGSGAGSYNTLFEKHRPERFADEPQWTHNDYLNTLSDYGLVGFVLFFGAVAVIAVRGSRQRRVGRTRATGHWIDDPAFAWGLVIGLLAFGFQLLVDFHFKIPALGMACAVVAALAVGSSWPSARVAVKTRSPANKALLLVLGAGCWAAVMFWLGPQIRGEAHRYRARQTLDQLAIFPPGEAGFRAGLESARNGLGQAVRLAPANGQAWADLSYAISLWGHVEPERIPDLGKEAEAAAERALKLSPACFDFWIRRGVARNMQGRWYEAGNDFVKATSIAPRSAFAWYYYAEHLSRKTTERALAEAALEFCLRLDPGNPAGLALRHRLAISPKTP